MAKQTTDQQDSTQTPPPAGPAKPAGRFQTQPAPGDAGTGEQPGQPGQPQPDQQRQPGPDLGTTGPAFINSEGAPALNPIGNRFQNPKADAVRGPADPTTAATPQFARRDEAAPNVEASGPPPQQVQLLPAGPPQPEPTAETLLHEEYIHGGQWYGPGKVRAPRSVIDQLNASQTRILEARRNRDMNVGPALTPTPPVGAVAVPAQDGTRTVADFEKTAQESGRIAGEQAEQEQRTKEQARLRAEGRPSAQAQEPGSAQ